MATLIVKTTKKKPKIAKLKNKNERKRGRSKKA